MRILHITARSDVGGGPEHIAQLVKGLKPFCDQFIACPNDQPYFKRFCDILGQEKIKEIPHRRFELSALGRLARFVKHYNIEIVHSHGKGAGVYGRLLTLLTRTKSVHTFHGVHTGGYGKTQLIAYIAYERLLATRTARAIAVSNGEKEKIKEIRLFPAKRIEVVCNGVALGEPTINNYELQNTSLEIVAVNRFDYQKNAEGLIAVAKALTQLYPSLDWSLKIYGDGKGRKKIQKEIEALGLDNKIKLPGNIDSFREALRRSDIFISASRWEGLPLAALEAMSEGLPIILSDVVGNCDLVTEGNSNGYLYNLDHPERAAGFISELSNEEMRGRMSVEGIEIIRKNYSIDSMTHNTLKVYRRI